MTRRFSWLFIVLLATGGVLRADTTNSAQVKSAILENNVAYLRVGTVGKNLAEEIDSAQSILAAMKQISGTVPDLRFADGDTVTALEVATNVSASRKLPLVVPNKSGKYVPIGTMEESNLSIGQNPLLASHGTPTMANRFKSNTESPVSSEPASHGTHGAVNRALTTTNKIIGTVLDLRFANGDDFEAARAATKLFASMKSPLAILVNGETRGAAAKLATGLREERAGLIFGSATADLKPDITVTVTAQDERALFKNPYEATAQSVTNATAATNSFSPFIDHTSEADLVRSKIKDGEQDEDSPPAQPSEPQKPFIHDPVLARAVDLIKALAVVHPSRS